MMRRTPKEQAAFVAGLRAALRYARAEVTQNRRVDRGYRALGSQDVAMAIAERIRKEAAMAQKAGGG